jgi:hypothetical protein
MKYRDVVCEIALDRYGYVTTREAIDAGVPAVEFPKLAARGGLMDVAYGLYRVPDIPLPGTTSSPRRSCASEMAPTFKGSLCWLWSGWGM